MGRASRSFPSSGLGERLEAGLVGSGAGRDWFMEALHGALNATAFLGVTVRIPFQLSGSSPVIQRYGDNVTSLPSEICALSVDRVEIWFRFQGLVKFEDRGRLGKIRIAQFQSKALGAVPLSS